MALDRRTEVHSRLPGCQRRENGAWGTRSPGCGAKLWGGLTRDVHNLWPDTGQSILEKNQDIWNNRQDLLTMNPLNEKCDLFTCLNFRWKYPLYIYIYRAFPDRSLHSLKPGDILKIIHSNLFSLSMFVITCIGRSHKEHIDEKSTLGRVMAWCYQTASYYLTHFKQVYYAIWRHHSSNNFSIYFTLSPLNLLVAWYFQYFGYQQAWQYTNWSWIISHLWMAELKFMIANAKR